MLHPPSPVQGHWEHASAWRHRALSPETCRSRGGGTVGGIFSGMNSTHPSPDDVISTLGTEFVEAFIKAVEGSEADFENLREYKPDWAVHYSSRFVANFLHERIWGRIQRALDSHPNAEVTDKMPKREFMIEGRYRVRVKRHDESDAVKGYKTRGANSFWSADLALPGMEVHPLSMGYRWDSEAEAVVYPLMTLRDGQDKAVWAVELQAEVLESGVTDIRHVALDEPAMPELNVSEELEAEAETDEGEEAGS